MKTVFTDHLQKYMDDDDVEPIYPARTVGIREGRSNLCSVQGLQRSALLLRRGSLFEYTESHSERDKAKLGRISIKDRYRDQVIVDDFSVGRHHVLAIDSRHILTRYAAGLRVGVLPARRTGRYFYVEPVNTKKNDRVDRSIALDMRMFVANLDNMRIETTTEYPRFTEAIWTRNMYSRLPWSVRVIT